MNAHPRSLAARTAAWVFLALFAVTGCAFAQDPDVPAETLDAFESHVYLDGQGGELPYRLLVPDETDGPRPLLLFLHGAGERGTENERQLIWGADIMLRAAREYGCIIVAPQCPPGEKWSVVDWSKDKVTFSDEPSEPMRHAQAVIDQLIANHDIDTERLYIAGLSMGGYGTWDAVCRWPGRFAAAVPICGGGDPAQADKLAGTPIWAFHGAEDKVVDVERSRVMIEAVQAAGGEPKYTEYLGVGHNSWTPAFAEPELLPWLMSQNLSGGTGDETNE